MPRISEALRSLEVGYLETQYQRQRRIQRIFDFRLKFSFHSAAVFSPALQNPVVQ